MRYCICASLCFFSGVPSFPLCIGSVAFLHNTVPVSGMSFFSPMLALMTLVDVDTVLPFLAVGLNGLQAHQTSCM